MKKTIILFILLLTASAGFSQKVKIKNNIAKVDGSAYVNWTKQTMGNEISVSAIGVDEEELFMSYQSYTDPTKVSNSNPEGTVRWIELNFLTLNLKCEVSSRSHKAVVKLLYLNNIYDRGRLNADNVKKLIAKYGMRFSENRPNGNVKVIINNN